MSTIVRRRVFVALEALEALLLSATIAQAQQSPPALPDEWAKVRQAMEKYQDVIAALRNGYRSAVRCVQDENRAGMGIHFGNARITGPVPP